MYVRFLDLVVNKLPKYPNLKKDERSHKKYKLLVLETPKAMDKAEKAKSILQEQIDLYNKYLENQKRKQEELSKTQNLNHHSNRQMSNEVHDFDDFQFEQHLSDFFAKHDDHKLVNPAYPSLNHVYKEDLIPKTVLPDHPTLPPKVLNSKPESSKKTEEDPKVQHKSIASTEGGKPLKTLYTPKELESSFLKIAQPNTNKKLETCGILCGKLSLNAFFITTLLIPKQESTANTCSTTDEESIFEYIDNNDLFVLGWIHTHPTQSCFLSSVDLHTQNSYQIMLPEAIAMVCAPKFPPNDFGIFRLTDPPGIGVITNCKRTGFHPHDEGSVYKRCNKSNRGHVVLKNGLPFKVVDLR